MKKAMKFVIAMAMVLMMSGGAMAQGSALVSGVEAFWRSPKARMWTYISLSNITDKTIQCRVTVYDHDGNDATQWGAVWSCQPGGYGSDVRLSTGTGDFEIPAHSTRIYMFGQMMLSKMSMYGHGTIEWKSSDTRLRKAIIGNIYKGASDGSTGFISAGMERDINSGQPF